MDDLQAYQTIRSPSFGSMYLLYWSRRGAEEFHYAPRAAAICSICLHLPRHHLKGWIYKNWLYTSSKSCFFSLCMQHQVFFFISSVSVSWKAEFIFKLFIRPKLRQLVKLALYIWSSPSYLDVCREIAAYFQANQARQRRLVWTSVDNLSKGGKFADSTVPEVASWTTATKAQRERAGSRLWRRHDQTNTVYTAQARLSIVKAFHPCMPKAT